MTDGRAAVFAAVAERMRALVPPWRVAIDGVTASGKSVFAGELVRLVPAFRVTIDDFHRPPPHEYYPSSFDLQAFRSHVLELRENVVADGVFLHHPALRDLWDLTVFLRVEGETAWERGIARDQGWMANARERYAARYIPGERRYLAEVDPETLADVVVENSDFARPRLLR